MLRPGGKASRIYKKISSQDESMPKKKAKKSPKSKIKESKEMEEEIHRRSYPKVSSREKRNNKNKISLLQSREYSLNPKARNP